MNWQIANGGVQYVPQIAVQYVHLDFDGELTDYNGEILTIEGKNHGRHHLGAGVSRLQAG